MSSIHHRIAIGTVQFGLDYGISNSNGKTPKLEVSKIINYCRENGIDTIDTASAYGDAEKVLGQVDIAGFKVVSKFLPNDSFIDFQLQLDKSLGDLKLENIYGYLAHRPLSLLEETEDWKYLTEAKNSGKIKKIGFSLNKPVELDALLDAGLVPDMIQAPYNYLDRRFEKYFEELHNMNVEIHCRSAFMQGLFYKNPLELSDFFSPVKGVLRKLHEENQYRGCDYLGFVLANKFVSKLVLGVENLNQLKDNLEPSEFRTLPDLDVETIPEEVLMPMCWPN